MTFAGLHRGGATIQNTWAGASWDPDGIGAECPDFTVAFFRSLSSMHSYALTSQGGCCPRVWTDAGWECRAQLDPTAAVYLIKTWEDPSVARPKGDTDSIYRVVERAHTHMYTHTLTEEQRSSPLSLETIVLFPNGYAMSLCATV